MLRKKNIYHYNIDSRGSGNLGVLPHLLLPPYSLHPAPSTLIPSLCSLHPDPSNMLPPPSTLIPPPCSLSPWNLCVYIREPCLGEYCGIFERVKWKWSIFYNTKEVRRMFWCNGTEKNILWHHLSQSDLLHRAP